MITRQNDDRLCDESAGADSQRRVLELEAENAALREAQRALEARNAELERVNAELEVARAQLQTIISASADGIMVVDGQHRVLAVNPALEKMTGFSAAELLARPSCAYSLGARREDGQFLCDTVCPFLHSEAEKSRVVDAQVTTKDGRRLWVSIAYGPIRGPDGRIEAVVHTIRDISERKELERAKDEFFSLVNHEIKGPLTAAKGYAQLLLRRVRGTAADASFASSLEVIDRQISRVRELVDQLLEVSRAELGRMVLQPELTDLAALARETAAQLQVTTSRHSLLVQADEPVNGYWDRARLEGVLRNLLTNAIRYSPNGGEIVIGARLAGREALVWVQDQGIGISAEAQRRLFEPYYRASAARSLAAEGLGLGLYICQQVIAAHGGRIWVESEEGRGSKFAFSLPVSSPPVGSQRDG